MKKSDLTKKELSYYMALKTAANASNASDILEVNSASDLISFSIKGTAYAFIAVCVGASLLVILNLLLDGLPLFSLPVAIIFGLFAQKKLEFVKTSIPRIKEVYFSEEMGEVSA